MAFDRHPEPKGFQVPDEPLRLRMDAARLAEILPKLLMARAS